jgi:hypothetical protein
MKRTWSAGLTGRSLGTRGGSDTFMALTLARLLYYYIGTCHRTQVCKQIIQTVVVLNNYRYATLMLFTILALHCPLLHMNNWIN